jgi:aryl-alcohol dehydrogenase-like predicted oxidoreductase
MNDDWTGTRRLGRSGITVSALGLGTWAAGGPTSWNGAAVGWGATDDDESVRAIRRGLELGVTFFDTAPAYGAGRAERLLGRALAGRRHEVVLCTKFGIGIDEDRAELTDLMLEPDPARIRAECAASLRRLHTDVIDLFLCHPSELPIEHAPAIRDILEDLVADGLIRAHGWSTDDPAGAAIWSEAPHCTFVEHTLNLFNDAPEMLALCERADLGSVNRSPLAMGLLTGAYRAGNRIGPGDIRGEAPAWLQWFEQGEPSPAFLARLDAVREVLTSGGRTLAQGALAWVWGRSGRTVPIPGFRTVAQVEENAGALRFGPLTPAQMTEVAALAGGTAALRG